MSINISKALADKCEKIELHLDLSALGPRQRKSFDRMLHTGIIEGWNVPATVAKVLRDKEQLPYVHLQRSAHWLKWGHMHGQTAFFDSLVTVCAAAKMQDILSPYQAEQVIAVEKMAKDRPPEYHVWLSSPPKAAIRSIFSQLELPAYPHVVGDKIIIDAKSTAV